QSPPQTVRRHYRPFSLVRPPTHSLTRSVQHLRHDLREILHAAVHAADAGQLVRTAAGERSLVERLKTASNVDVIAVGKAAGPMLNAFVASAGRTLRCVAGIGPG